MRVPRLRGGGAAFKLEYDQRDLQKREVKARAPALAPDRGPTD